MRHPIRVAAVVIAASGPAGASNDVVFNVAQPLVGYAQGLIIGFEGYASQSSLGYAGLVPLTCSENSTRVLVGGRRGVATENRNAASLVGLAIRHEPKAALVPGVSEFEPYFGDTLRVVLEIPEYAVQLETSRRHGWKEVVLASLREVVCATVECALINAASSPRTKPGFRYLAVEIEGWDGAADLAGTYSLEEITPIKERVQGQDRGDAQTPTVCR